MAWANQIIKKLEWTFFGFWVKRWRVSFLVMVLILFIWMFAIYSIPKESSPDIKFWIISINTVYQWSNPKDIDNLITEKIEQQIKDIDWIKKISSTSLVWFSSIIVELDNDADASKVLVDIKDSVDKVSLPADVDDPVVTEISTDNERMFKVVLFADSQKYSQEYLKEKAKSLKDRLDWRWDISRVDIDDLNSDSIYEIYVLLDKIKTEQLWLSVSQIIQNIRGFNVNQPLGNHILDWYAYDFRVQWELTNLQDLWSIPIYTPSWSFVLLQDIAKIEKRLKDDSIKMLGTYNTSGNYFVSLLVNKNKWTTIFSASKSAKQTIEKELKKQEFIWIDFEYTEDLAEIINKDYNDLAVNWLWTIVFVFLVLLFFVWFKEALIASISVPLAFMVTFFVLNQMWLSMNFLINFSLIICFGIAIDATIVVVQWAHQKLRQWYNPKSSVLLAVKEYSIPLIAGTATTLVVFLPMMTLPGIMWKFLAYIPITIFITLLASLFVSLTINSALYFKLSKKNKVYEDIWDLQYLPKDEMILLEEERKWKTLSDYNNISRREKFLDKMWDRYTDKLSIVMKNPRSRILSIIIPIFLLLLSFIVLSPSIGFNLFPSSDSNYLYATITAKKWLDQNIVLDKIKWIDSAFANIPEIKIYYYILNDNKVSVSIDLFDSNQRKRDSFQIEKDILQRLSFLKSEWLQVETEVQAGWPLSGKAIWIKLIAETNENFDEMLSVAKDFESYLGSIDWTKNITISSTSTPGQFVFLYDIVKLSYLWIKPWDLNFELYTLSNGLWAGSIKQWLDNDSIKVKYNDFDISMSPTDISSITINTIKWPVKIWAISNYFFDPSVSEISREWWKIVVKIEADIEQWLSNTDIQSTFVAFAKTYNYPKWISFESGWENQENSDLITAMWTAFLIALFLIFAILLLQFNSFLQPVIILYSVILWLLWANVWLWITGNSYSLAFMIGFIALTGIVVNNAIVLIDRINEDIARWKDILAAIEETGKSRLAPILSTTFTTVLWLLAVSQQDKFFAGLGYTIIFGLLFSSLMTLFIIPAIYHDKIKIIKLFKRSIISFIIWLAIPLAVILLLIILWLMLGLRLWTYDRSKILFVVVFIWYFVFYLKHILQSWTNWQSTYIDKIFNIKVVDINWNTMSKRKSIKRLILKFIFILGPLLVWTILWWILKTFRSGWDMIGNIIILLGYLFIIFYGLYRYWISDNDQTIYDEYCGTLVKFWK